jgi:hypothetical protein
MYDPNYKLKFRPDPISRLLKRSITPLHMVGDPPEARVQDWDQRMWAVYEHMIAAKNGIIPSSKRKGIWFYADAPLTNGN